VCVTGDLFSSRRAPSLSLTCLPATDTNHTTDMYLRTDTYRDLLHWFTHAHDSQHATLHSQPGVCTFFSQMVPCVCLLLFIWHALMGAVFFRKEGVH
jgi:hypothetical protein